MKRKVEKEEVVRPPLHSCICEPYETRDLREGRGGFLYFPENPIKFLVIVGINGNTIDAEFVYFLLTPTRDGSEGDRAFHANLLKAFVDGKGEFSQLKKALKDTIDLTLDMRHFVFCVAGGGLLYQRGHFIVADDESRDFGPFSRIRVKKLLKNAVNQTGMRPLILGTSDSGGEISPLRNFHL